MSYFAFYRSGLAGLLLFGSQFLAQAQTISSSSPESAVTTGIVGVTSTQTARLNVLSLQAVIPGVAAVQCPATLEFYDDTGALLKQLVVTNISPATAASLVFKPTVPSAAANARAQIRAVVSTLVTAVAIPGTTTMPMPTPFIPVSVGCNLMPSLEIIDDSTGGTHTYTSDLRAMSAFRILQVLGAAAGR
jgi:hypothetical protein